MNRVFTFFLLVLVAFTSCKEEQKQTPSSYPTMTVKKESRNLDSRYSAAIRGRQDIEIYPQVGGTLQQLLVTEGQRVSKGQVLFDGLARGRCCLSSIKCLTGLR